MAQIGCADCVSGVLHSGTPSGRVEKLHGLQTYIASPEHGVPIKGVVVLIPDAFGWQLDNTRVLADSYALKGQFLVYLPDFMDGHYLSEKMLSAFRAFDSPHAVGAKVAAAARAAVYFPPFLLANRVSVTKPRMSSFLESVKNDAATSALPLGVGGFCWGGKFAMILSQSVIEGGKNNLIDCSFVAHPSQLAVPDDIEGISVPLSIAIGDNDSQLPAAGLAQVRQILENIKKKGRLEYEIKVYPGAKHGFSIRGDPGNEMEKTQGMEAENQAIAWFTKHLKVD